MENNQANKPSKSQPQKRQRKAVYLDAETEKILETVKKISSYGKTKDTVLIKRALEYVLHNKQDLNEPFERLATKTDIERSNKKHIGKLNSGFEIFQAETFQNHQFIQQSIKQLSKQLKELQDKSTLTI